MDSNRRTGQTTIISDLDAIALAQQAQRKVPKKPKKAVAGVSKKAATAPSKAAKKGTLEPGPSKQSTGGQHGGVRAASSKSKPANNATKPVYRYHYVKDGLKIPFNDKSGRLRPHARLGTALRNKGTGILLGMVEEIGGPKKRKEFIKRDLSKLDMATWIEEVETRALGPNPKSLHFFVKDDFVIDTSNYVSMAPSEPAPTPESVTYEGKGEAAISTVAQNEGKRKRDSAIEPARGDGQTRKKPKTRYEEETHVVKQSLPEHNNIRTEPSTKNGQHTVQADILAPKVNNTTPKAAMPTPQTAKSIPPTARSTSQTAKSTPKKAIELPAQKKDMVRETPEHSTEQEEELDQKARLQKYMELTGLHVKNQLGSSHVVVLHDRDEVRILTASTTESGRSIIHETCGPIDIPGAQARLSRIRSARPAEPPFLQRGRHGRHGDFRHDASRRTGRGHQVTPQDQLELENHFQFRAKVFERYPRYPVVGKDQEVAQEIKEAWNDAERWYNDFTMRYPGFSVNHLWPCGCEKLRGEDEDSESEAE